MAGKKGGYVDKFLKKADKAIQEGVKKADEIVEFGSMTAKQAAKTSIELRKQAIKEKEALQKKGAKKISEGLTTVKRATSNTHDDLEILEKIGKLRKAEIITEKEFQAKKKKILDRI